MKGTYLTDEEKIDYTMLLFRILYPVSEEEREVVWLHVPNDLRAMWFKLSEEIAERAKNEQLKRDSKYITNKIRSVQRELEAGKVLNLVLEHLREVYYDVNKEFFDKVKDAINTEKEKKTFVTHYVSDYELSESVMAPPD